jgi:hypothetical protein
MASNIEITSYSTTEKRPASFYRDEFMAAADRLFPTKQTNKTASNTKVWAILCIYR